MASSLNITADDNGHFRHPDGCPLVVIFDSKDAKKLPDALSWQEPLVGDKSHTSKGASQVFKSSFHQN
jgi:hypothetical protein